MRAVVLDQHGGPDVLTLRSIPDPVPDSEEILVDVVSTAVNRADLLQRLGFYPGPPMEHEVPGLEFAGRVSEIGSRVTLWQPGDAVMGIVAGGSYAERLATHERQAMAVPHAVPLTDAGAIPEVWITAYDALVLQGGLTSGRVALVHAGASGVGTASIQVAHAIGAKVIVTASAGKRARLLELGADAVVDYGADDFVEVARSFTDGHGVDVVLDVVGGDYVARNVEALALQGTIVQVGVMGGGDATVPVGAMLMKRATLVGTVLRARPLEEKVSVTQQFSRELLPLFADGRLAPVIDSRFPLDQVARAHERMEDNANVGKIVLDVAPDG